MERLAGDAMSAYGPGMGTRLIIVEDEPLFREMLREALQNQPGIAVVGVFDSPDSETLARILELQTTVAVLDIEFPGGGNGIRLGRELRRRQPDIGILLLSHHADPEYLKSIPSDEWAGWSYLLKQSVASVDILTRAIRGCQERVTVLDPALTAVGQRTNAQGLPEMSPRQQQILALIVQGYSNRAISKELAISLKSVENQINLLYQAIGIDAAESTSNPRVLAVRAFLGARWR